MRLEKVVIDRSVPTTLQQPILRMSQSVPTQAAAVGESAISESSIAQRESITAVRGTTGTPCCRSLGANR